jgi:putative flippase GtrA
MSDNNRLMKNLTLWDLAYVIDMAIACGISYAIINRALVPFVDRPDELLGGMWAVVATIFVFRDSREGSLSAGRDRLIATCVSFALCLAYLLIFPFTPVGMMVVIGVGSIAIILLGRWDDIVTTGITTAVVMVAAALSPQEAWHQPLLRLVDTVVGVGVGVSCKWAASYAFYRMAGEPVR